MTSLIDSDLKKKLTTSMSKMQKTDLESVINKSKQKINQNTDVAIQNVEVANQNAEVAVVDNDKSVVNWNDIHFNIFGMYIHSQTILLVLVLIIIACAIIYWMKYMKK